MESHCSQLSYRSGSFDVVDERVIEEVKYRTLGAHLMKEHPDLA